MGESAYRLDVLKPNQVHRTYLLMHAVVPDLTLAEWQQTTSSVFRREEIITATNAAGTVQGVCIYRIREHGVTGRLLDIPFLIAVSAGDANGVASLLLEHVRAKAKESRCRTIRIWTLDAANWRHMQDPGFSQRWDHGLIIAVDP